MSVVFIGGSRRLSRLNDVVRARLDNIVERNHAVLIGDANGGDRAVQAYLAERLYPHVTVYCTNGECRNNVGGWPVRPIQATRERGFDFYALKDAAMAADAECGFMLWDGESKGTLFNIRRLLEAGKPVVVYVSPKQECVTIRGEKDLAALLAEVPAEHREPLATNAPRRQRTLFPQDGLAKRRMSTARPRRGGTRG